MELPTTDPQDDEDFEMTWIAVNDQAPWTRSLRVLSDAAYRLYDQALRFSNHELTDGVVLRSDLEVVKVGIKSSRISDHIEELCLVDLWHRPGEGCSSPDCPAERGVTVGDGWVIHDYFDLRPSREQMLVRKRKYQARAQKAGLASGLSRRGVGGTTDGTSDELTSSPQVDSVADLEPNLNGTRDELQIQIQKKEQTTRVSTTERNGDKGGLSLLTETSISPNLVDSANPVQMVYDSWISGLPEAIRHRRALTETRKKDIRKGLKTISLADCMAAVRGVRWDPWKNRSPRWNDIKYCLAPENWEQFRDWENGIDRPAPEAEGGSNVRRLPAVKPWTAQADAEADEIRARRGHERLGS